MSGKKSVVPRKKGYPNVDGRPRKEIDEALLFKLAQTMLSQRSIASILECSEDTLQRWFSHILTKAREMRKCSLVEAMWAQALEEKDTKMMIWLSKQHLGYRDTMPDQATQVVFNVVCNEIPK